MYPSHPFSLSFRPGLAGHRAASTHLKPLAGALLALGGLLLASPAQAQWTAPVPNFQTLPTRSAIDIPAWPNGVAYETSLNGTVVSSANTRYVNATSGLDTNTGTSPTSAWQTFAKALSSVPANGKVIFAGGTYRVNPTSNVQSPAVDRNSPVLMQPASASDKVWILGSKLVPTTAVWTRIGTTNMYETPWTGTTYPVEDAGEVDVNRNIWGAHRDMVFLNGVALKQVGERASTVSTSPDYWKPVRGSLTVGASEFCLDYVSQKLILGMNPAAATPRTPVEITHAGTALNLNISATGSVIQGLGFAHFAKEAVRIGAQNVRAEYNSFAWNAKTGIWYIGVYGYTTTPGATNNSAKGNYFFCNGQAGTYGGRIHGITFESNTLKYNNCERTATNNNSGGVKFTESYGQLVKNNLCQGNWGYGIWLDIGTRASKVLNNRVYNNHGGIFFEISGAAANAGTASGNATNDAGGVLIAGNVVVDNGSGIMVANSRKARIYNNTLSNNNTNLIVKEPNRKPEPWEYGPTKNSSFTTAGTQVVNNIFYNTAGASTATNLDASPAENGYATPSVAASFNVQPADVKNGANAAGSLGEFDTSANGQFFSHNAYYSTSAALIKWAPTEEYTAPTSNGGTPPTYTSAAPQFPAVFFTDLAAFRTHGANSILEAGSVARTGSNAPAASQFFTDLSATDYTARNYNLRCDASAAIEARGAATMVPDDVADALGWNRGVLQIGALRSACSLVSGAVYQLSPVSQPSKVLDVDGHTLLNGGKVQQYAVGSGGLGANQQWRVTATDGGFYKVSPLHSNGAQVLDATGGAGTRVQQWAVGTNGPGLNQQWSFTALANGSYRLTPRHASTLALSLTPATGGGCPTDNGIEAMSETWNASRTCQQWQLTRLNIAVARPATALATTARSTETALTVYPNPAATQFTVALEAAAAAEAVLTMTDPLGRLVRTHTQHLTAGANSLTVEVRSLPTGLYLLQVRQGAQVYSQKVQVQP